MSARSTVVYVSNADSGDVSVLRLDTRRGTLATLQTLALGGTLMPMALHPRRHRLYVARRSAPEAVLTLAVEPSTGTLAVLAEAPMPASLCDIGVDASGRWLLGASYGASVVVVAPIDEAGRARAPSQVLPAGTNAHCIRLGGRFAWSTALGSDTLHAWHFDADANADADAGVLVANEPAALAMRPGSGPRHLALHPNGRVAYLLNERDAMLDVLSIDAERGRLSHLATVPTLPPGFSAEPWAADLHLTPDARFLYTSERRGSTIAMFRVDEDDGARVVPLGHVPVQAEPRGFHVEAGGRFLIVAGQASHRVGVHAIDPASGLLTPVDEHPVGQGPNWIETLRLEPAAEPGDDPP